jgi:hypothetical protein
MLKNGVANTFAEAIRDLLKLKNFAYFIGNNLVHISTGLESLLFRKSVRLETFSQNSIV